jgi:hypothetical protein
MNIFFSSDQVTSAKPAISAFFAEVDGIQYPIDYINWFNARELIVGISSVPAVIGQVFHLAYLNPSARWSRVSDGKICNVFDQRKVIHSA